MLAKWLPGLPEQVAVLPKSRKSFQIHNVANGQVCTLSKLNFLQLW